MGTNLVCALRLMHTDVLRSDNIQCSAIEILSGKIKYCSITGFIQTGKIQGKLENTGNLGCSGKYRENDMFLSKYRENTGN